MNAAFGLRGAAVFLAATFLAAGLAADFGAAAFLAAGLAADFGAAAFLAAGLAAGFGAAAFFAGAAFAATFFAAGFFAAAAGFLAVAIFEPPSHMCLEFCANSRTANSGALSPAMQVFSEPSTMKIMPPAQGALHRKSWRCCTCTVISDAIERKNDGVRPTSAWEKRCVMASRNALDRPQSVAEQGFARWRQVSCSAWGTGFKDLSLGMIAITATVTIALVIVDAAESLAPYIEVRRLHKYNAVIEDSHSTEPENGHAAT